MAARRSAIPRGRLHVDAPWHVPGFASRHVRIYTPAGDPGSPRPLLLLFDGQNVFDDAGSFAGGWHTHRAIEKLARKRPRPIVVGIDHGGVDRIRELSPFPTRAGAGAGESFVGWVAHTLVPEMRRRHAIVPGPAGVLIGGSSMGGLAATYAHFRYPEVFGGALAMSPSFWLGGRAIHDFVQAQPTPWTSRVYLDAGSREGGMATLVERMAGHLRERGYGDDKLLARVDPRGGHNEPSWRRRLPGALRFFYRA